MDASQEQTDVESFAPLEPRADGFRNYTQRQAQFMRLRRRWWTGAIAAADGPEMTVLVGGLRVLGAMPAVQARRLHQAAGTLTNDFFVNLLDMSTQWQAAGDGVYEGATARRTRSSGPAPAST
jgi:catalase-peroxidase